MSQVDNCNAELRKTREAYAQQYAKECQQEHVKCVAAVQPKWLQKFSSTPQMTKCTQSYTTCSHVASVLLSTADVHE